VWLYYRFGVSLRDVSELMLARGIEVSHEAIRLWTLRFGTQYARRLRRRRGTCSNIWHLDELCLVLNGQRGWLWRAIDDAGDILDILVQRRRSARAAKRFFRKLLKGLRMVPRASGARLLRVTLGCSKCRRQSEKVSVPVRGEAGIE
jgi:putative transposase